MTGGLGIITVCVCHAEKSRIYYKNGQCDREKLLYNEIIYKVYV